MFRTVRIVVLEIDFQLLQIFFLYCRFLHLFHSPGLQMFRVQVTFQIDLLVDYDLMPPSISLQHTLLLERYQR